jgi:hypothetical protein
MRRKAIVCLPIRSTADDGTRSQHHALRGGYKQSRRPSSIGWEIRLTFFEVFAQALATYPLEASFLFALSDVANPRDILVAKIANTVRAEDNDIEIRLSVFCAKGSCELIDEDEFFG